MFPFEQVKESLLVLVQHGLVSISIIEGVEEQIGSSKRKRHGQTAFKLYVSLEATAVFFFCSVTETVISYNLLPGF